MSDKKELKDEELEKASGGELLTKHKFIINATHEWICPACLVTTSWEVMPDGKNENGIEYLHCPKCNGWYPFNQWRHEVYWGNKK